MLAIARRSSPSRGSRIGLGTTTLPSGATTPITSASTPTFTTTRLGLPSCMTSSTSGCGVVWSMPVNRRQTASSYSGTTLGFCTTSMRCWRTWRARMCSPTGTCTWRSLTSISLSGPVFGTRFWTCARSSKSTPALQGISIRTISISLLGVRTLYHALYTSFILLGVGWSSPVGTSYIWCELFLQIIYSLCYDMWCVMIYDVIMMWS